jgi:hypothetical protein
VSIQKSGSGISGVNGGAVSMLFGPILGKSLAEVTVQAVAVLTAAGGIPGRASPGPAFPMAVRQDFVNRIL